MNKAEKSLRWVVNQIPDFEPKTNEEKMLLNIKFYCNAGANEISRLTAEIERLRTENAELIKSDTSKEHCIIEEHNEVHYWRDRAKQAEARLAEMKGGQDG